MFYLHLFFFKTFKHKNAVKKENKYDAGILKTSDRSTNIIFSYPQSRDTIPLSRMSNIYRGAILNEIASFFNSQVSRYSEEIKTVKRESAAMKSELESLKLKLKFCSRSTTDGIIKECQVVHIPRSAKLPSLARASRKNCSSLTTQIALLGLCHEFFSVLLWLKLGWNFFVSSCSYL